MKKLEFTIEFSVPLWMLSPCKACKFYGDVFRTKTIYLDSCNFHFTKNKLKFGPYSICFSNWRKNLCMDIVNWAPYSFFPCKVKEAGNVTVGVVAVEVKRPPPEWRRLPSTKPPPGAPPRS